MNEDAGKNVNLSVNRKYLLWLSISGFFLSLDQLTKLYVHLEFKLSESMAIIPNYFNLTYVRNYGAAFGVFGQAHPMFRDAFFLIIPPIALIVIFFLLRKTAVTETKQIVALSLVFGGALGNYIDRLKYRYVIDFIDFHYHDKLSWPAFNIADACIVVGICLLLFFLAREPKQT
ncbi:MAG: signal peptidase II [Bdellovibrionota bacterium]